MNRGKETKEIKNHLILEQKNLTWIKFWPVTYPFLERKNKGNQMKDHVKERE